MIRGSRMGSRYATASFDTFRVTPENRAAVDACKAVKERRSNGVILIGPAGTGKTHLMVALAKAFDGNGAGAAGDGADLVKLPSIREMLAMQAAEDEFGESPVVLDEEEMRGAAVVEYWPILDLVTELRNESKSGAMELSRRCCRCALLILDDFGQERATDFVFEELERIIDWRYRDEKPIAVSTNLTLAEIVAKYGNRAVSRWAQQCEIVEIGGKDMRAQKQ